MVERTFAAHWVDLHLSLRSLTGSGWSQPKIQSFLRECEDQDLVELRSVKEARTGEAGYRTEYDRLPADTTWRQVRWSQSLRSEVAARNYVDPFAPPPERKNPYGAKCTPIGGETEDFRERVERERKEDERKAREARDASPVTFGMFVNEREARREAVDGLRAELADLRAELAELKLHDH